MEVAVVGRSREALELALDLSSAVYTTWLDLDAIGRSPVRGFECLNERLDLSSLLVAESIGELRDTLVIIIVMESEADEENSLGQIRVVSPDLLRNSTTFAIVGPNVKNCARNGEAMLGSAQTIQYISADLRLAEARAHTLNLLNDHIRLAAKILDQRNISAKAC